MILELTGNDPSFWIVSAKITVIVLLAILALSFSLRQFRKLRLLVLVGFLLLVGLYTPSYVRNAIEHLHSDPSNGYRSCAHFLVIHRRVPLYSGIIATGIILLASRRSASET